MILEEFNKKYIYQSDLDKYGYNDIWEIPKEESDGFIRSDCESYCRFLKNNIKEFKDWNYYFCKLNNIGHCILIKDNMVIDCNTRSVVTLELYLQLYNITELKKYSQFIIFGKILNTKILLLYKLIKDRISR